MKICFIDKTDFKYSFNDKDSPLLRGAETTLINLSYNLSLIGNEVYVFNNCSKGYYSNNYKWQNINVLENSNDLFDIAIANGDINLLNNVNAKKKYAISHSIQTIEKFIRKKQLLTYFKNRPKIILIGTYHKTQRNILTRLWGYDYLELSIDDNFINTEVDLSNKKLSNQAIFTSRPDRNGEKLIEIWKDKIFPFKKDIKLLFTPDVDIKNLNRFNIFYRQMKDQIELIKDLKNSRVMLLPGHKAELFCLAAEEARELCIPTVTLGIGSLKERVVHNETGFVAKNDTQFAKYTLDLFNDDNICIHLKKNLYTLRNKSNWIKSAKKFLEVLYK